MHRGYEWVGWGGVGGRGVGGGPRVALQPRLARGAPRLLLHKVPDLMSNSRCLQVSGGDGGVPWSGRVTNSGGGVGWSGVGGEVIELA